MPAAEDDKGHDLHQVWLGLMLSITGNCFRAVGFILQKTGHNRVMEKNLAENAEASEASFVKNWVWQVGMVTYVLGSFLHLAAMNFGPLTLLMPMEAITLVANTFLAPHFLGESIQCSDYVATFIIIAACVLAVIFGPKEHSDHTGKSMIHDAKSNTFFIILSSIIIFITLCDYICAKYIEHRHKRDGVSLDGSFDAPGASFLMLSYSIISAVHGAFMCICNKAIAEIFASIFKGKGGLGDPWTYFFIGAFIYLNLGIEWFKQKALAHFGALYVVPIWQVLVILGGILIGGIFFREFGSLSDINLIMFTTACILTAVGVVILAHGTGKRQDDEIVNIHVAAMGFNEFLRTTGKKSKGKFRTIAPNVKGRAAQQYRKHWSMFNPTCANDPMRLQLIMSGPVNILSGPLGPIMQNKIIHNKINTNETMLGGYSRSLSRASDGNGVTTTTKIVYQPEPYVSPEPVSPSAISPGIDDRETPLMSDPGIAGIPIKKAPPVERQNTW